MNEINRLWLKFNEYSNKLANALGRTNNIVGEYAEYLAHKHYGGSLLNVSGHSAAHHSSVIAIQNALAKALEWNQMLITGLVPSMSELARQNNVTQRYIAHLIKMAFLAPDIMTAIKQGKIPAGLSLDRLKKGFSLDWEGQRIVLGFNLQ